MTETEYIAELEKRWPKRFVNSEPTVETMNLTLEALSLYPQSEKLWIMRGDLLQLVDYDDGYDLKESERCYRQAIGINPKSHEAYLELAHFIEVVLAKPRKAKKYFEKARRLKNA
ncbi:hypothetical protein [Teredinibacter turnerae]|uniref:hypothetical protein n=1 Tax=Teredinibacter turnerae TaxID=2426 RepID=UPI0005F8051F|nr:hypothetical protein [Teredinibacter turnerae]